MCLTVCDFYCRRVGSYCVLSLLQHEVLTTTSQFLMCNYLCEGWKKRLKKNNWTISLEEALNAVEVQAVFILLMALSQALDSWNLRFLCLLMVGHMALVYSLLYLTLKLCPTVVCPCLQKCGLSPQRAGAAEAGPEAVLCRVGRGVLSHIM